MAEEIGARDPVVKDLLALSWLACQEGTYDEAEIYQTQAVSLCREIGDPYYIAYAQARQLYLLVCQGRQDGTWALLLRVLPESMSTEVSAQVVPMILEIVGQMGVHLGQFQRGAELLGLSFHLHSSGFLEGKVGAKHELDMAGAALGAEGLAAALARGATLDMDDTVAEILACDTPEAYWG
jgi:hypothetical protein